MQKNFKVFVLGGMSTLALAFSTGTSHADVKLHSVFSNDMVLQREKPFPVWGTADAGEKISVQVGAQTKSTVAAADGSWRVTLDAMPASESTPFVVKGNNEIALKNVAVGEVYLCSGQSNMEFGILGSTNAQAEIAAANFPNLRYLYVPKQISGTPQKTLAVPTTWTVCSPQSVASFSAVAYYFGREMNQRLGVPIGLISASVGATVAQAWTSRDTLVKRDDLRNETVLFEQAAKDIATGTLAEQTEKRWQNYDPGTKGNWSTPGLDDAAWKSVAVPSVWERNEIGNFDGVVWYRKQVEIPAAWAGKDVVLHLGAIDDRDTTFFNGAQIGASDVYNELRQYKIPTAQVKAGRAVIAVRVYDLAGDAGFTGGDDVRLELANDATQKMDIAGDWKYHKSIAAKDLPPAPQDVMNTPNRPSALFNGMIAPLIPFAIRGAIWYQGEASTGDPAQYRTLFPDLIHDWRTQWNAKQDGEEFGFYFVQLANFMERTNEPVQSGWAELREAQTMALKIPRTGMATTLDIGEANDIHPKNKQDVGKRLALAALAIEHGQKLEYSGPSFSKMETVAGKPEIKISFSHAQGLKTTDGTAPRAFAIQDEAGKWFAATARIEGQSIVLSNPEVLRAVAVRYAWANNPDVNLVNAAGLPAVSFRTDAPTQ